MIGQIINNPIETIKVSNPIDYIIFFGSNENLVTIKDGETQIVLNINWADNYYDNTLSYLLCHDESNN